LEERIIKQETRSKIKGFLEGFIQGLIDEYREKPSKQATFGTPNRISTQGNFKPFHEALLTEGVLRINSFERSFSTKLGTTFEEVARLIARDYHVEAERGHNIRGRVSTEAIRTIESIINSIGSGGMKWSFLDLVKKVMETSIEGGEIRTRIADLYIKYRDGKEYYFEIKSPKPNKGQCLEATDRLLQIHAIKRLGILQVNTFYAMAYNPYGDEKRYYNHSFAKNYMDLANQVLIGKEFWDLIGSSGTYEEVLEIYQEVGKEKGHDMIDQLALDY